jgi:acetyl esterase/lipase
MADQFEAERGDIVKKVRAAGKAFTPETIATFAPLYAALHARTTRPAMRVTRNIAYGAHSERQLLDIYEAEGSSGGSKPVVIFFHGGGLIGGSKDAGGPYYGNVAEFFAAHECIGINATYRLAPEFKWPEGARDVGSVVAWARQNAESFGGDPDRIVLVGHSAGATHVAGYVLRKDMHPAGHRGFAAAILMSGVYGIDAASPPPNHRAYYGEDRTRYEEMQVVGNVTACDFPLLLTIAEYDPLRFESGGYRLLAELVEKGAPLPRVSQFLGHNHITPAFAIGAGDEAIEEALLGFLQTI